MKSKYINKICFDSIGKDYKNKSDYMVITSIEKKENSMVRIEGIYFNGKEFNRYMPLNLLYKKLKILDPPPSHLIKEFIKRIFI